MCFPRQIKFKCSVCWNDGTNCENLSKSAAYGKIETKCKHDICGICYTKIILLNGKDSKCPICRCNYIYNENHNKQINNLELVSEIGQLELIDRIYS